MMRKSSDHKVANDNNETGEKAMGAELAFSPELPARYAREMVELESRGNGDQLNAMERVARRCGMSSRSLRRLMSGETKDPGTSIFLRVHRSYLELCRKMAFELQEKIKTEAARLGDDRFKDYLAEAQGLYSRVNATLEEIEAERKGR